MVNRNKLELIVNDVLDVIPDDWPRSACSRIIAAQIINDAISGLDDGSMQKSIEQVASAIFRK